MNKKNKTKLSDILLAIVMYTIIFAFAYYFFDQLFFN